MWKAAQSESTLNSLLKFFRMVSVTLLINSRSRSKPGTSGARSSVWLQIKAELHKPAVAALILVPNLISLIQTLLNPIFIRMGTDMLIRFARISVCASFGINTALTLALAVFVLVFGLIIKKQPAAKVQEPEPASEQKQSADLPFNVPAGVSTDDL